MGKWLAVGSIALAALLVLLWLQIRTPADAATAEPTHAAPVAAQPAPAAAPAGLTKAVGTIAQAETQSKKFATDSDEFFYAFQDIITQVASKNAMTCYTGGIHSLQRHEKVKFKVKDVIKNGEVTMTNVEIAEHTFDDPAMIACMKNEIEKTHWHDDRLPDYEEDDIVLIRPGSLVNKFGKEALSYEGSGPDFTKQHPIANENTAPSHVQPPQ
jgi:hypothetical protein